MGAQAWRRRDAIRNMRATRRVERWNRTAMRREELRQRKGLREMQRLQLPSRRNRSLIERICRILAQWQRSEDKRCAKEARRLRKQKRQEARQREEAECKAKREVAEKARAERD